MFIGRELPCRFEPRLTLRFYVCMHSESSTLKLSSSSGCELEDPTDRRAKGDLFKESGRHTLFASMFELLHSCALICELYALVVLS